MVDYLELYENIERINKIVGPERLIRNCSHRCKERSTKISVSGLRIPTRAIDVHLVPGDITIENTDCVVHPTNSSVDSAGQVGQALIKVGGPNYKNEADKSTISNVTCVTGSGNLPSKYVIHVDIHAGISWAEKFKRCFIAADNMPAKSIAMPAIGTGANGADPNVVAEAFSEATQQFLLVRKNLEVIRVIIFEQRMINCFAQAVLKIQDNMKRQRPNETYKIGVYPAVEPGSSEYNEVNGKFTQGICIPSAKVESIQKYTNRACQSQYEAKHSALKRQKPSVQIEREVWHGTTADRVNSIFQKGLENSRAGSRVGSAYGKGVYFGKDSRTSASYAGADGAQRRRMFLCNVLTGQSAPGKESYTAPPSGYESCVDNVQNPNMYVVFNDDQILPKYLVTFST